MNNLRYHEDTVEKRSLNQDDIDFLLDLQKEMNTQDTICQADPRFWVIMDYKKEYGFESDYANSYEIIDNTGGEYHLVGETMEDLYEDMKNLDNIIYGEYEVKFKDEMINISKNGEPCDYGTEMDNIEDVVWWLNQYVSGQYEIVGYKKIEFIIPNTFFMTHKEAKQHLKANPHHYSSEAHTYVMTAWRSPEVNKLWKLLQEIDWNK